MRTIGDVATGSMRLLRTFNPWQNAGYGNSIGPVSLSPDGRWIAYSTVEREGAPDRHLYLLAADGSAQRSLTSTAGISEKPEWTLDGASVLFMANWAGSFGLWSVPVQDGRPSGSGTAMVLEIARAFTQAQPKPKRSLLFLLVTATEQGRVLRPDYE